MRQFGKVEIPQSAFINVLKHLRLSTWEFLRRTLGKANLDLN